MKVGNNLAGKQLVAFERNFDVIMTFFAVSVVNFVLQR